MSEITFAQEEQALMVRKLQAYFEEELHQELGRFDAEFLLDFFSRELGATFYNRGVHDARAVLAARTDELHDALYQLEKPGSLR